MEQRSTLWHHFLTSGLLGWLSSLQPCFCLRLPQDQNYTKLSSTWPSVAMEIHHGEPGLLVCKHQHVTVWINHLNSFSLCSSPSDLTLKSHVAPFFNYKSPPERKKERKIEGKRDGLYKIAWETGVLHIFCVELRSSCCCYSAVTYFLPVRLCWLTYDI